jgi:hypothetical protein
VPDNPQSTTEVPCPERAWTSCTAEVRARPVPVGNAVLRDDDIGDLLTGSERDLAIGAAECPVEGERDVLGDRERPVGFEYDLDFGSWQVE